MTYVIRSNGKKEEFDGEKLLSSIMAAADDAGIANETGVEAIIKNIMSNTISSAQTQEVVQSKTLKDIILAQLLKIGIQMAIQKFGASNVTKEDVISELINAGLQMSSKSSKTSQSNDLLSQLLGTGLQTSSKSSNQSNDILSQLLGTGLQTSSKNSKTSASNDNLEDMLKTGMKLANAWMKYNR
ncbi:MAG: ATP cone domain-containing protein [Methanofastidiosum sp.]